MDDLESEPQKPRRPRRRATSHPWLGFLLAALVFAVYFLTLSHEAYPGESAQLLTTHSGIDPLRPLANPIYGSIVRNLGNTPAQLAYRMNLFSAICGAICTWLVFTLAYRFQWDKERTWRFKGIYLVQGSVSALFFAFSTSVWFASSRAYPAMFDLVLLLSAVYLINTYRWTEKRGWLFAFALLYGIGMVEYTTFYLWMFPLGVYTIFHMFKHEHLSTLNMSIMVGLGLLGLSLYLLYAWWYYQLPVAEYREVPTYIRVLRHMGHEQLTSFMNSLPRLGWLTVAMVSIFPWSLSVLFSRAKSESNDKVFALIFFLILLTAIAGAVFYNTVLSPWRLIGPAPLLVSPYVFTAIAFGWCAAQFYSRMMSVDVHGFKKFGFSPVMCGIIMGGCTIVFIGLGCFLNYKQVDTRSAETLNAWADQTLESLGEREWMISTGLMDPLYLLASHAKDQPLHLLNVMHESQAPYRAYYSSLMEDERLQSLARIGLGALLSEWFVLDPDLPDHLGIEDRDTIWASYRIPAIPVKTYFAGVLDTNQVNLAESTRENLAYWQKVTKPLHHLQQLNNPASPFAAALLAQTSRKANDLGVLCESMHHPGEAAELYAFSRELYPANLSAMLNQLILAKGTPAYEQYEIAARNKLTEMNTQVSLSYLINTYGAIHAREAYLLMQKMWKIEQPKQASKEAYAKMQELYLKGQKAECMKQLEAMVRKRPDDLYAWNFYAALAGELNDEAAMYTCLNHMRASGQQWPLLLELMGNLEFNRGNPDRARNYYEESIKAQPMNKPLLELLVRLDMQEKDFTNGRRHIHQLLTLDPGNATATTMLGMIHFMYRDYVLAENAFRSSIDRSPTPMALNNLSWILHLRGKHKEALPFIKLAIEMNHDAYNSWDTLGVILTELEAYPSALTAIDKAISLAPEEINPYIHRAQLFHKQDEREKALAVVQQIKLKFEHTMQTKHKRALEFIEGI